MPIIRVLTVLLVRAKALVSFLQKNHLILSPMQVTA